MSRRRRAGLALLVAVALGPLAAQSAAAAEGQTTVGIATDAWYATGVSGCTSPIGCPPVPVPAPNTYPPDTLHVEATVGKETARSYLGFDLSLLPFDASLTGGTVTLPLSAAEGAGTSAQKTAALRACLVTATFQDDAEGSTAQPPAIDCQVKSEAKFVEQVFTLELGPFVQAWQAGKPQHGVALVPALETAPTAAWHLAFDGHKRTGQGVRPITASFAYTRPDGGSMSLPPLFTPPGADLFLPEPGLPPPKAPPAVAPVPRVAAPVPLSQPGRGFQYPAVMLVPLVLLAGGMFLVRTFTQNATPLSAIGSGPDAIGGALSRRSERRP